MSGSVVSFYVCKETFSIRACVKHTELDGGLCVVRLPRREEDKLGHKIDWSKGDTVPLLQVMPDYRSAYELLKRFLSE